MPATPETHSGAYPGAYRDNCAEWAYIALECYAAVVTNEESGDSAGSMFHEAEGAYCTSQATACFQFGSESA